jgi:hypothetical protein
MPLFINHVWFGNNALGALEKFNIYTWKSLGATVTIYAKHWTGSHTADSLGVKDVTVVNIGPLLDEDDQQLARTLPKTRELLKAWLAAAGNAPPGGDGIYNMVDVTKSYIGGTRRGIVLDLKVGPSSHVAAYQACFDSKFVSYTRGGNTAGDMPENQCIGTMQAANTQRDKYANSFEANLNMNFEGLRDKPNNKWFDLITGFHGRAYKKTSFIDVATKDPGGGAVGNEYEVQEIGDPSHGPFRVFKKASDQSNKSTGETTPQEVKQLCQWVWDNELSSGNGDPRFLKKVQKALQALPG